MFQELKYVILILNIFTKWDNQVVQEDHLFLSRRMPHFAIINLKYSQCESYDENLVIQHKVYRCLIIYLNKKLYIHGLTETDSDYLSFEKRTALENYLEYSTIVPVIHF